MFSSVFSVNLKGYSLWQRVKAAWRCILGREICIVTITPVQRVALLPANDFPMPTAQA